jgi:hypothetical protein
MTDVRLIATYDLVVFGGSAGAVACAIAAAAEGRRVLLAAPRSYLGDDISARLALWRAADVPFHQLTRDLWATADARPAPLHCKRTLDEAVLVSGIDLLLETVAVGLLRAADGSPVGALIANRGGRQAVAARRIVDATRTASVLRLAGIAPQTQPVTTVAASRVLIGGSDLAGERLPHGVIVPKPDGKSWHHAVRRTATIPWQGATTGGLLATDAAGRFALWDAQALVLADDAAWDLPIEFGRTASGAPARGEVVLDELSFADGRIVALGSWAGAAYAPLTEPAVMIAAGDRLGRQLATAALPASLAPVRGDSGQSTAAQSAAAPVGLRVPLSGLRPLQQDGAVLPVDDRVEVIAEVDVLVVGGGTGGAPAGIAAARAGARTLVIERLTALGGVGTLGQIAKYWHGNTIGFTAEADAKVHVLGGEPRAKTVAGLSWDAGWKARWWHEALAEAGGSVWFGVSCVGVQIEHGRVVGVLVASEHGTGLIRAKAVVDGTGAAEIPYLAGAPTVIVGGEHIAVQGTGLADIHPGRHYHNSDHTFCDDSDPVDATRMFIACRQKFGPAWDLGQLIDSRERRRIVGEVEISPLDILADRTVPDAVVRATSNFDSHGFTVHPLFLVKAPDKSSLWSWIPYRSLLPQGIDGVLVTGLGMSAHRDALPVVRMQADVQNAGYAAGLAAALAAATNIGVKQIDLAELQRRLVAVGNLPPEVIGMADSFPVDDATIVWATTEGLDHHRGIALCLAEPQRARAGLLAALTDPNRCERAALILGVLGDAAAAPVLRAVLAEATWDAGWEFTGMGQFGMSMSRIDGLLVALATCGGADDVAALTRLAGQLTADAAFSHLRACSWAAATWARRHPVARATAAAALARLLALPGMTGHACTTLDAAVASARRHPGITETITRNDSLKELHLAVGLWRCGDQAGAASQRLEAYRSDLRGHYARHVAAVLAETTRGAAAGAA